MALPPKGDPRRPLHLAVRSMRLLGILFIFLSSVTVYSVFILTWSKSVALTVRLAAVLIYFVPGLMCLLCAFFLKRRKRWAIIVGIVLALFSMFAASITAWRLPKPDASNDVWAVVSYIVLGILVAFIVALAQLVYQLFKSFTAMKIPDEVEARGFEPLMQQPMISPPAGDLPHGDVLR